MNYVMGEDGVIDLTSNTEEEEHKEGSQISPERGVGETGR